MTVAKYAPILPIGITDTLAQCGIRPDYVLLLAPDVLHHTAEYSRVYGNRPADVTVILDNGVAEHGEPLAHDLLAYACEVVRPTYVVLPDVVHSSDITEKLSVQAAQRWEASATQPPKFMGVPQGSTVEEYVACANTLVDQAHVSALAVTKFAEDHMRSRLPLLHELGSFGLPIHLLGFTKDLDDDVHCATHPRVIGIDSAMPIWHGQRGKILPQYPPRHNEYGRRPQDYMQSTRLTTAVLANIFITQAWIEAASVS